MSDIVPPECVWPARAELGEGPCWSVRHQALYWVDVASGVLHVYSPSGGTTRSIALDAGLGCVVERTDGRLAVTTRKQLVFLDEDLSIATREPAIEADRAGNRFNDGKVDAAGRLWAGTMPVAADRPTGALYCIEPGVRVTLQDDGYGCTNGPAWSRDGRTMYHTDSTARTVYAFDFDVERGTIRDKRPFVVLPPEEGYPDGMTVDAEDGLWVAHWGGGRLSRFNRRGRRIGTVKLPVAYVTSCAFGGPDLEDLYITTATQPMSDAARRDQPEAGGLFVAVVGVAGVAANLLADQTVGWT
jgi:D-xylonolactonase